MEAEDHEHGGEEDDYGGEHDFAVERVAWTWRRVAHATPHWLAAFFCDSHGF